MNQKKSTNCKDNVVSIKYKWWCGMKNYQKELEMMILAGKKAGNEILKYYNKGYDIKIKDDNSEVTNADLASEKIIKEILMENFPNYAILSEETYDDKSRLENEYCFIIDPLDGTKDFINKTDSFAINVALSYKQEIVAGVIVVPCQDIIYYASKDNGAFKIKNDDLCKIHVNPFKEKIRLLISNFFFKEHDEIQNNPLIGQVIPCGSSYKAGLIAEGKGDLVIKRGPQTKQWDTAPIEIIIKEAGGIITDSYGESIKYNTEDVYNRNGFLIASSKEILDNFKAKKS